MAVKARWYQPIVVADDDPFAAPIEDVGVPIRLDGERAQLANELLQTVRRERELGVRCPIKRREDTCCHACPISEHRQGTAKGELCRIGRQQESLVTRLAVLDGQ